MALYLTNKLTEVFAQTNGKTLVYFFCDLNFKKRKTATSVKYIHDERGPKLFTSFDAVWSMFIKAAGDERTGFKFCIIDALDECDAKSRVTLLQQLEEAFSSSETVKNFRVLVTSRPYPEVGNALNQFAAKAELARFPQAKQDIDYYLDEKVAQLAKRNNYIATQQVKNILRDKAQGTFLWIRLACGELAKVASKDAVKCLQCLPEGLEALYGTILEGMETGNTHSREAMTLALD
ncbi:hypothetical protein PG994_005557 [Apiospora phragmitis]|uniref:Nephrocystin 3-like N-terminal domain-containing protein n=1 Tax=Apiospora phragmitis TaxID=2905665 RepID=A0ABR1VCJ4_9PEZI